MKRLGLWSVLALGALGGATLSGQVAAGPAALGVPSSSASSSAAPGQAYRSRAAAAVASAQVLEGRGDADGAALWRRAAARWTRSAQALELALAEERALETETAELRRGDQELTRARDTLAITLGRQARAEAQLRAAVASAGPIASGMLADLPPSSALFAPAPAPSAPPAPSAAAAPSAVSTPSAAPAPSGRPQP